jgi:hypothetical protein
LIGTYLIGKEKVLRAVAAACKRKICVEKSK